MRQRPQDLDAVPDRPSPLHVHESPVAGSHALERRLGFVATGALVVSNTIAVGIFLTPGEINRMLASPFWILVIWLAMGAMAVAGALCYGALAARRPEAGGGYVYVREAFGPRLAFLYGWKCFLVMDPGLTAALVAGLFGYVRFIVPLGDWSGRLAGVAVIATLAAANALGGGVGVKLMGALTALKLTLLAAVVIGGFASASGSWSHFLPFVDRHDPIVPFGVGMAGAFVSAFFSFGGWWEVTKVAGEVRDPERTLPRALTAGLAVVTLAYVATSAAFLYAVPLDQVRSGDAFVAELGERLFGRAGGVALAAIVIVSVLGSLSAFMLVVPRLYVAMARDGLFPTWAASVDPRLGTPARAIAIQAIVASLLVLVGTFQTIIAYFVFITVAFIGLTAASVFVLHRRSSRPPSGAALNLPGYPFTPVLFLAFVIVLLGLLLANRPREALVGAGITMLGLPVYRFVMNRGE
jgi:APA family basic amino acid/polyamine antiporter